jgi:acetyltransferase-like isoleucine patch superfamily enzyme
VIHPTAILYPDTVIGEGTSVGAFSIIGKPYRPTADECSWSGQGVVIGRNCHIGAHVVVGQGAQIGDDSILEDGTQVEVDVSLGSRSHLLYGAQVCNEALVGNDCIIGGFVCERAQIGRGCRVFGKLVHRQLNPTTAWDEEEEDAPIIDEGAFVGFDALVIGGLTVGRRSYVCAGAIVTKDLPENHVGYGTNKSCHFRDWKGALACSPLFAEDDNG